MVRWYVEPGGKKLWQSLWPGWSQQRKSGSGGCSLFRDRMACCLPLRVVGEQILKWGEQGRLLRGCRSGDPAEHVPSHLREEYRELVADTLADWGEISAGLRVAVEWTAAHQLRMECSIAEGADFWNEVMREVDRGGGGLSGFHRRLKEKSHSESYAARCRFIRDAQKIAWKDYLEALETLFQMDGCGGGGSHLIRVPSHFVAAVAQWNQQDSGQPVDLALAPAGNGMVQ